MNKKRKAVLLGTMITLALQTGSAYAEKVTEGVYENYVEFGVNEEDEYDEGRATISSKKDDVDVKDKEFTFKNGATIDSSKLYYINSKWDSQHSAGIINTTENNEITINLGNNEKKSKFNLITKTPDYTYWDFNSCVDNGGKININATNTDMNFSVRENENIEESKPNSAHIGILNGSEMNVIGDENKESNLYLEGQITNSSIYMMDSSKLNIKNLNNLKINDEYLNGQNSAIDIGGVLLGEDRSSMTLENINNIEIKPSSEIIDRGIEYGIYMGSGINSRVADVKIKDVEKFQIGDDIDIKENGQLESVADDKVRLVYGIRSDGSDFRIENVDKISINSVAAGIYMGSGYNSSVEDSSNKLKINTNSIYINAIDKKLIDGDSISLVDRNHHTDGVALLSGYISTGYHLGADIDIEAKNNIVFQGDNSAIVLHNMADEGNILKLNANNIVLTGDKEYGIYQWRSNPYEITAGKNISIFGALAGIRNTARYNVDNKIESDGNIEIVSDKYGVQGQSEDIDTEVLSNKDKFINNNNSYIANKDIKILGKDVGLYYKTTNSTEEFFTKEGDIYINGNNIAISSDSYSNMYPESGNLYDKHSTGEHLNLNIKAETGDVFIGDVQNESPINNQGIIFTGKDKFFIDGNKNVFIRSKNEAVEIDKLINGVIKGGEIKIISLEGEGIKSEGTNSLEIGYNKEDDKVTENIYIEGNIGVDLAVNNMGKDEREIGESDTNKTIINANNVDIIGKDYGIRISQDATDMRQERDNNIVDFANRWRNGVLAINAKENIDILATEGTAIDVNGVNKIAINNSYNNKVVGNKTGISLNLSTKIPLNLKEQIKEYKDNSVKAYIRDEYSGIKDSTWNGNLANSLRSELDEAVKKIGQEIGKEYEDFNAFYEDLFKNTIYQENPELVEVINKMNPEGDPLQEYVKATGILEAIGLDVNNLYEYTYGDYVIGTYIYAYAGCNSIEECYDKLVSEGKFEGINTNIDVENSFKLTTGVEGVNTIIGGEKALNADGQVNAVISGGSNVISNYVATPLDEDKEVEPTYAVKAQKEANVDITATNGSNIIQSTGTGIYATDENTIVNVKNETENKEKITQDEANQIVTGEDVAINADNKATVNLTGKNAKNYISGTNSGVISDNQAKVIVEGSSIDIYSSEGTGILAQQTTNINTLDSQENESTTIDLRATDINITGGKYGVKASENSIINIKSEENGSIKVTSWNKEDTKENETASIYAESTENEDAEINIEAEKGSINLQSYNKTVWASGNGGEINIKGGNVNIGAYSIERDGEGQHIAIVAGTNDEETNEKIGKVNVEIVGSGDNNITGDIIGGRSGEVKVKNKGEGALAVTGDILAGNGGAVDISFGNNSFFKGRVDDYQDAGKKADVENGFYDPHFTNEEVKEKGTVNIDLGKGTVWNVTGESWITSLNVNGATIDLLDHENDNSNYAINIGEISGDGRFIVNLDAENLKESQMIYIYGTKEGKKRYVKQ